MSNAVEQVRWRVPNARLAGAQRLAGAAARRARLSVVPRPQTRAARVPFVILVTMVLVGGVVGLLLFNTSMQQASFAATKLQTQATLLAAREQTLLLELEGLRDPQRVARAAVQQGMVPGRSVAFLRLSDGQVLGTPAAAAAADAVRIDALPTRRSGQLRPERADTAAGSPRLDVPAGRNGPNPNGLD